MMRIDEARVPATGKYTTPVASAKRPFDCYGYRARFPANTERLTLFVLDNGEHIAIAAQAFH